MVEAVDGELAAARGAREQRALLDVHGMQVDREARAGVVAVDVLDEVAAHRDVRELQAAADAEHGQAGAARGREQRQLVLVAARGAPRRRRPRARRP